VEIKIARTKGTLPLASSL